MQPCDHSRATTSILIVDAQSEHQQELATMLAPLGHLVLGAVSSEQALALLGRQEVALLVLSDRLGELDAFETAALVKTRLRNRKVPILFVTDEEVDADRMARQYAQGAVDFVRRPLDARILRSKAAMFVDWHMQSEENKRQLAEVRRRDRQRYEEQTLRSVRNLTDLMPLCVWAANRDGEITYTNKAWMEYTGLGAAEANDRGHLAAIHADDRERVRDAWAAAVRTGDELVVEYRLRRSSDGSHRWHLMRAIPERGPRGNIVGWIATATDIDDQKRTEEKMSELAARAEAASRMKDEFLATVSHELRTPLNAIYGWTRMLCADELDARQARRAMETIERNTRVQIKLVEDLLDVSRIVAGKLSLDLKSVAPAEVVRSAVEAMTPTAQAKDVELRASYDGAMCRVSADPNRLQQVVWNLIANAIKFTPPGGRVQVTVAAEAAAARIEVNDSGHGIAPEFLPHVFDPFRQADGSSTRTHGGLGLGLAIVKHIVELHRGTVEVQSDGYGRGACFVVRLPLAATAEVGASAEAEWSRRPSGSFAEVARLDRVHVLVVDDDVDSRDMLTMVLEQYGATVTRAASAAEALRALEARRPDVLLSDIGMPGEDGYALIRRVREEEAASLQRRLPAIALTGYATAEDGKRALEAGFQLHLPKPIDPAELLTLVGQLLDRSAARARMRVC